MERWARMNYQPCIPLGADGTRVTGSKAHIAIARKAACDGIVLLKNEKELLPLKQGAKVALFGRGHVDYIRGGGGSGSVATAYTSNIFDGFLEKEKQGKVQIFHPLSQFYFDQLPQEHRDELNRMVYAKKRLCNGVDIQELAVPQDLVAEAAKFADVAVVTICRYSSEGYERSAGKGDFYLSQQEDALLEQIRSCFDRIAVVLNVGGVMDVSWFADDDGIQSALMAWKGGMEGGYAVADILCGDVTPSGKLTDTFAKHYTDYPSAATFLESEDYAEYPEDIYNGYRYFETIPGAAEKVVYPFGYGLSYTKFAVTDFAAEKQGDAVTVSCKVQNVGSRPGREVVQVYGQAPQGKLGKAEKVLCAFDKTVLLQPGEAQQLNMTFGMDLLASYDDLGKVQKSAFLLESGTYQIHAGTHLRNTQCVLEFKLEETQILRQCKPRAVPTMLKSRMLADGSMEQLPVQEKTAPGALPQELVPQYPDEKFNLFDVAEGKISVEELVAHMTDMELGELLCGHNTVSVSPTNGIGGGGRKSPMAIPNVPTADGPAGLRVPWEVGIYTTAFPTSTQIACSWDMELAYEVGAAIAREVKENNIGIYLAPALNIHRDPLCGRNFEYFSEDPLVSGKMAAAVVRGVQDQGIAATVKHFACNGMETNRRNSDSRISERAMREIYLKGFEIAIRDGQPWALMTAYNMVNGVRTSQSYDLITGILREEWGYDGAVMTDWNVLGSQADELLAGNDIKMPSATRIDSCKLAPPIAGVPPRMVVNQGVPYHPGDLIASGEVPRAVAQQSAKRVLELLLHLGKDE